MTESQSVNRSAWNVQNQLQAVELYTGHIYLNRNFYSNTVNVHSEKKLANSLAAVSLSRATELESLCLRPFMLTTKGL